MICFMSEALFRGLEKMLKMRIVAASHTSDVQNSVSFASSESIIMSGDSSTTSTTSAVAAVNLVQHLLQRLSPSTKPFRPTPNIAALSFITGCISRVMSEKTDCDSCVSLALKATGSSTSALTDGLISHQDTGGFCYPAAELLHVLHALKRFMDVMLMHHAALLKPLKTCVV
ncbi:hypothetical protein HPB51_016111 [Rhipicephalus microplus]|uniref:Uncharacterized protein n=1 Tax=Rhipicephalus microplus TaxID=6941 RepID=A0A9J6D5T0_RHIMP|nr:hypothetical protein HPB51_016111 [Rhipicephalus microplus]